VMVGAPIPIPLPADSGVCPAKVKIGTPELENPSLYTYVGEPTGVM
jgi:hypothetical protein